ncbi:MAG: ATP-dependent Clp protease ATP-binding subunit [Opitutaceae bacterium]|nr:ATP-dependent Clp protease ATP-binding subunit [Opitutaceae bacterium]
MKDRLTHLQGLEPFLRAHLRGQDPVVARAAAVFLRGELGLARGDRPRGAFLAVGPTGTGKTELVLLAARYLFGEDRVRRIDLSEFQRIDAVERLLGADPSDSGVLGRLNWGPSPRVWLFDELEKAHPKAFDLFIQILEPGSVTLATGEKVSFQNDYLAFTSNLGSAEAVRMARSNGASVEQAVLRRVGETLRPELVGRIPDRLVFSKLSDAVQREIAELHLANELTRLRNAGFDLEVSTSALEFLIREGFHPHLGARSLRQTIERHVQDAVVQVLFSCGARRGCLVADVTHSKLRLEVR